MAFETQITLSNLDEFGLGSNQLIVSKGMSICRDFLISKLSDYIGGADSKFVINENDLDMGFTSDDLSTTITSDMIKDLKKQIINQQNFIQNKLNNNNSNNSNKHNKNNINNNNNNHIYLNFDQWDLSGIIQFFIKYMVNSFYSSDSNMLKGLFYEVLNFRNLWAHQRPFSLDDSNRLLDTLERIFITLGDNKMASMMQNLKHTHYFYSFNKIYGLLSLDKNSTVQDIFKFVCLINSGASFNNNNNNSNNINVNNNSNNNNNSSPSSSPYNSNIINLNNNNNSSFNNNIMNNHNLDQNNQNLPFHNSNNDSNNLNQLPSYVNSQRNNNNNNNSNNINMNGGFINNNSINNSNSFNNINLEQNHMNNNSYDNTQFNHGMDLNNYSNNNSFNNINHNNNNSINNGNIVNKKRRFEEDQNYQQSFNVNDMGFMNGMVNNHNINNLNSNMNNNNLNMNNNYYQNQTNYPIKNITNKNKINNKNKSKNKNQSTQIGNKKIKNSSSNEISDFNLLV